MIYMVFFRDSLLLVKFEFNLEGYKDGNNHHHSFYLKFRPYWAIAVK